MYPQGQELLSHTFPTVRLVSPSIAKYREVSPSTAHTHKTKKIHKKVFKNYQNRVRAPYCSAMSLGMTTNTNLVPTRTIDVSGLRSLFGLGRTATYELTHDETFPQAYGITPRHYVWNLDEVEMWLASRKGAVTVIGN